MVNRAEKWQQKAREAARAEAVELELPSGMEILARRPDPLQLAAWDRLPMQLVAPAAGGDPEEISDEDAAKLAGFMRDVIEYCCLDPRVSTEPGENTLHPREIPHADWTFIINWALRVEEGRAVSGFRSQRADGGAGGDGGAVRCKTQRAARGKRSGDGAGDRPGGGGAAEPGAESEGGASS